MNDERVENELRAAILQDDPGPMRDQLRSRVAGIPDEKRPQRSPLRVPHISRPVALLEAVAAVAVIGAIIGVSLYLRGGKVGPASSAWPSVSQASLAASGLPAATPADFSWSGLRWSAPSAISGACSISDIVAWHGELIALGTGGTCPSNPPSSAIWRSSDGSTWTLSVSPGTFGDATIEGIVTTPSGLVAWGVFGLKMVGGAVSSLTACTGAEPCGTVSSSVALLTSHDGVSWTPVNDTSMFGSTASIQTITWGPHGLVAIGAVGPGASEPAIWVSASGTVWQRLTLPSEIFKGAHFYDLRASASAYSIVGDTHSVGGSSAEVAAAAWWSGDGRTWAKASIDPEPAVSEGSPNYLRVSTGGFLAVASESNDHPLMTWTSRDGRSWKPTAASSSVAAAPSILISDDGTRLVAVGAGDLQPLQMWSSSDGVTWQPLPFSGDATSVPPLAGYPLSFIAAFVLPDGLVVIGGDQSVQPPAVPVWHLTAQP